MIVLLSTNLSVTAQEYQYVPFPDSNAVWSEVYWKSVSEPCPRWVYNKYAIFNEDTIIGGTTYHKLFHTNASEITKENSNCIGGIREDSLKKVWVNGNLFPFPDRHLRLLFDFSLKEKDTLWMDENFYNCTCEYLSVEHIDTIKIKNSLRKVFSFYESSQIKWIEGIGNIQGLLWCAGAWPTNGIRNDLICMHQNDTLLYYFSGAGDIYYDDCVPSFVLDGLALLPNPDVNVYPNPVSDGAVYFENLDFEWLELFDSNGCSVFLDEIKGQDTYTLPVSQLPPGIYFYRLKTKGLVPTGGRLVIQ